MLLLRLGWLVLTAATLALFAIGAARTLGAPPPNCAAPGADCQPSITSQTDARLLEQMGVPLWLWLLAMVVPNWLAKLSLVVLGAILVWRRSDDWVAVMLGYAVVPILLEGGFPNMGALAPLVAGLYALTFLAMPLPFVFPNGRHVPRWTRWVAWPLTLVAFAGNLAGGVGLTAFYTATLIWMALTPVAMIYRYRRVSTAAERQQTKWVVIAFVITLPVAVAWIFAGSRYPAAQPSTERLAVELSVAVLSAVTYFLFTLCLGIAMLRYRLWDVDLIIRRTLIYGALTMLLAVVYLGTVLALQVVFTALTGQSRSQLVTVLSTLAIAALFVPLRARVQASIDRAFYRRKYDAARTLAAFSHSLRDEVNLLELNERLLQVVDDTMHPDTLSLWVKKPDRG